MKRVTLQLLLALAALYVSAGCQMAPVSSMVVRSVGGAAGPTGYEVDLQSPELESLVKVVRAVAQNAEGERVAQIDVQNISNAPVALEYQFRWRDRFGSELVSLWEWRHITVATGRTIRLEDEVADSEWVHYICELRLDK